jgi:probable rRNA maturation factor
MEVRRNSSPPQNGGEEMTRRAAFPNMLESDQPASRFPIDTESLRRFLRRAQRETGVSGEVNVIITSNERIRNLNREFRGKDETTDVLSFPAAKSAASRNRKHCIAGDIAVSAEIARDNAESLSHSLDEEFRILLLHGLLHLAGYDHETDKGEMAKLEQRLRTKLNLPASLIERTRSSGKGKASAVTNKGADSYRGTTSVVSKSPKEPNTSLPKAVAQRKRSGQKKSSLLMFDKTPPGAKAQNGRSTHSPTGLKGQLPPAEAGSSPLKNLRARSPQ